MFSDLSAIDKVSNELVQGGLRIIPSVSMRKSDYTRRIIQKQNLFKVNKGNSEWNR